jgi:NAD(P)-dependent dehydrogenase (short-subunit alcohol dehydrogenase family)
VTIRFDDQVAIVTGAGGGMGRAYALELARAALSFWSTIMAAACLAIETAP